jgi:flagellin
MALSIYTNVASLSAQRNVSNSQTMMSQTMQQLSSGLRVNSAKDDASGFAIARRMEADTRGMQVAMRNAADGISVAQTAENALGQIGDMMQRMRELAVQSANGTATTADRANLAQEFNTLKQEITRVVDSTEFNGKKLLSGTFATTGMKIQVGQDNVAANQQIDLKVDNIKTIATAVSGYSISSDSVGANNALTAMTSLDTQINAITTARAKMGAVQTRFETAINVLRGSSEQVTAARGRIMDTDYASATANLTKQQILQQAGVAMLAQANQAPQSVLSLLR